MANPLGKLPILSNSNSSVDPSPTFPPRVIKKVILLYPFAVSSTYDVEVVLKDGQFAEAPIGLGYISAYVKSSLPDIEIEIFDANLMAIKHIKKVGYCDMKELWQMLRLELENRTPDLIGVSCLFHSIAPLAHEACKLAKDISKDIVTVMGGNYPTGSPEMALSDKNIDFIIFSEGEISFVQLLEAMRMGLEPAEVIDGIAYEQEALLRVFGSKPASSDKQAPIIRPKKEMLGDLEALPFPDRSNIDMEFYANHTRHFAFRTLNRSELRLATMTSSRGCPFKCTFCSSKDFWGQKLRHREPAQVVAEMIHLRDVHGINTFVFNDDNMMARRKEILRLCEEMKKANLDINWLSGGGLQVTAMKPDVIQALIETGFRQFNLAIETGNPATLRRIKKPLTAGISEEVIAEIRKYPGTWISSNFITGFYFETLDDIQQTLDYAGSLDLDWRAIYSFQPLPGTHDYNECVRRGYIEEWSIWDKGKLGDLITLSTDNFTADQVRDLNYQANMKYNFFGNSNIDRNPMRAIADFAYVLEMVPDHAVSYYCTGIAYENLGEPEKAHAAFSRAWEIVDKSNQLSRSSFKTAFAMTSASVRWADFFEPFNIDVRAKAKSSSLSVTTQSDRELNANRDDVQMAPA